MGPSTAEKVGVIVVHGVGTTVPGWIDSYLVPELEKWRAYDCIGALPRKQETGEHFFTLRCQDRFIGVAIGDDDDFRNFCRITGLDALANHPDFAKHEDRAKNRDRLRSCIGNTLSARPAQDWLSVLHASQVPAAIAFDTSSEVHRVRDPESSKAQATWESYTRRWPINGRDVSVSEFFWADLSKVGTTSFTRFSALIQLFLESPYVLGQAFLIGSEIGIHRLINGLILASNWIMHWIIAGHNIATIVPAFVMIALKMINRLELTLPAVTVSLLVVLLGGLRVSGKWQHRKPGLSDLGFAGSMFALFLLAVIGIAVATTDAASLANPAPYLVVSIGVALLAWTVWTALIVLAIVLVLLVGLKRLVWPFGGQGVPLARASAAISLSVFLGIIWKLLLTVFGILVIWSLKPELGVPIVACKDLEAAAMNPLDPVPSGCLLSLTKELLFVLGALNAIALVIVLLALASVILVRKAGVMLFRERANAGTLRLPRLIASPVITLALFAGALTTMTMAYPTRFAQLPLAQVVRTGLTQVPPDAAGAALLGLLLLYFLLARLVEMSEELVHVGRDLVDHQYNDDPSAFRRRLHIIATKDKIGTTEDEALFPRRRRIQARLESLIDEVIRDKDFDRLVFFGHSQGSVIVHDYLLNHNDLVPSAHYTALDRIKQIDVITIGSPLTHIYRHYFIDYDAIASEDTVSGPLAAKIKSWTNLYRVDDPIGREVNILSMIENIGIGPGGHQYYWKEDPVCAKLWSLIQNDQAATAPLQSVEAAE